MHANVYPPGIGKFENILHKLVSKQILFTSNYYKLWDSKEFPNKKFVLERDICDYI